MKVKNLVFDMAKTLQENSEPKPVIRLLRSIPTQQYYMGFGWTEDPEEAESFDDGLEALRTCIDKDLREVELVLRVPGATSDIYCTPIR